MRRAFTLIELLAIVAIIGLMTTVGMVSLIGGRQASQIKAAARDVYAAIKNARSRAIITGNRVIVRFYNEKDGEENVLKVDVDSALVMNTSMDYSKVQDYYVTDYKNLVKAEETTGKTDEVGEGGETIEEILFAPMGQSVVKGMCIRFQQGEDEDYGYTEVQKASGISIYSTADYWIQKYSAAKNSSSNQTETASAATPASSETKTTTDLSGTEESGTVVWETNGSVEPHKIWIYPEGLDPSVGMVISVDRFGGIKIVKDGEDD